MNRRSFIKSSALAALAAPHLITAAPAPEVQPRLTIIVGRAKIGKSSLSRRLLSPSLHRPATIVYDLDTLREGAVSGGVAVQHQHVVLYCPLRMDCKHFDATLETCLENPEHRPVVVMPAYEPGLKSWLSRRHEPVQVWEVLRMGCECSFNQGKPFDWRYWDCQELQPEPKTFTIIGRPDQPNSFKYRDGGIKSL